MGGVTIVLSSLFVIIIGSAITFFIGGVGRYIGVLGIFCSCLIIYSALKFRTEPKMHVAYGSMILVDSFISWIGAFGGFGMGFLLALLGGVLGIRWKIPIRE